jgi:DNA-nicking Smr family endonuclease
MKIIDDGNTLTVDLHGCSLADCEDFMYNALDIAYAYGRSKVVLIHGSSTSNAHFDNDTIKHRLYKMLAANEFEEMVASYWKAEDACTIFLPVGLPHKSNKIGLSDV